ncbi:MAG TPA: CHAD domain-containing protein [Gemmatimonadales bacterium]
MRVPLALPDLLVDEGARRLALTYLEDAVAARIRVRSAADREALHDYRVAVRHLRSCVRAYRRELRSSIGRKTRRQLRCLARATNRPRDLEVHLAWLEQRRAAAGEGERPGIDWLAARMRTSRERSAAEMLALDTRLFPRVQNRLESRLPRFRATLELDETSNRRTMAAVTTRLVRGAAARLEHRLAGVTGYTDLDALHRARIAAKRLRYLLEPFATFLPSCELVITRLKELQGDLGDVHDAQVFDTELCATLAEAGSVAPCDAALLRALKGLRVARDACGKQAFERTRSGWLGQSAVSFFDSVAGISEAIASLAHREREVERKFLLRRLPPIDGSAPVVEIEQGYLPGERLVERLRRVQSGDGVQLVRTLKTGAGLTRLEIEEPVAPELFERLWPLTEGRRVHKRRYRIPDGELTWEIDEFLDRDLVLAEVELGGRPRDVSLPAWLEPHVEREVTEDQAYTNLHLALTGAA